MNMQTCFSTCWAAFTAKTTKKGSFTVEAALIMTILIPVLLSLIYLSFFVHDRAVFQGIACEITAMASNLAQEDDRDGRLQEKKEELDTSRMLGTRERTISLEAGENQAMVSCSGSFPVPGIVMKLFTGNELAVKASWSRELLHPADTIRKVRGLKYMADSIKG